MSRAHWRLIIGPAGGRDAAAGPGAMAAHATGTHASTVPAATGARNMAVDQALLESAQAGGQATLRFYAWRPACLSFGRNQSARGIYDPALIAALGLDVVRRPTGGRAVLHDRELTYSVAAPVARVGSPRRAYRAINRALVAGLRALGVPASLAPAPVRTRGPVGDAAVPCFQDAAEGEVVAAGRKLVGSAQRYERHAILQHGSILLDGDQSVVARLAAGAARRPVGAGAAARGRARGGARGEHLALRHDAARPEPATLAQLLGAPPAPPALAEALARAFEEAFGAALEPGTLSPLESEAARAHEAVYGGEAWTWRR